MKIGISTSSGPYCVALFDETGAVLHALSAESFGAQKVDLSTLLHKALAEQGRDISQITGIIVDIGPGALTSTRVGVSFANALAYALCIPIHGISALEAQARSCPEFEGGTLLSLRPASAGRCYWALYENGQNQGAGLDGLGEIVKRHAGTVTACGPDSLRKKSEWLDHSIPFTAIKSLKMRSLIETPPIAPTDEGGIRILEPLI